MPQANRKDRELCWAACEWKPIEKDVRERWVGLPAMTPIARPGAEDGGRTPGLTEPIGQAGRSDGGGGGGSGFGCAWRTGYERSPGREQAPPPVRTWIWSREGVDWGSVRGARA